METTPFPDSLDSSYAGGDDVGEHAVNDNTPPEHGRKSRSGILSKLPFPRTSANDKQTSANNPHSSPLSAASIDRASPKSPSRAMAVAVQQNKTRKRKGSLRKVALLGRGAQRERKEIRTGYPETNHRGYGRDGTLEFAPPAESARTASGQGFSDTAPLPPVEVYANRAGKILTPITPVPMSPDYHVPTFPAQAASQALAYTSTTDEEDTLSITSHSSASMRSGAQASSSSGPYFPSEFLSTHRPFPKARSPLSIGGLAASHLPVSDVEWDYSETEWWGWVVLIITWLVFVTGMGSCLDVWSWAWDVGETPYAPPELEDDPTLPIVGYYPALIILTSVMAWVWVIVAWVGMKYFRHAKITGD